MNISEPMGAWHLATIFCRLAVRHSRRLQEVFGKVQDKFIEKARTGNIAAWTRAEQISALAKDAQVQVTTGQEEQRA